MYDSSLCHKVFTICLRHNFLLSSHGMWRIYLYLIDSIYPELWLLFLSLAKMGWTRRECKILVRVVVQFWWKLLLETDASIAWVEVIFSVQCLKVIVQFSHDDIGWEHAKFVSTKFRSVASIIGQSKSILLEVLLLVLFLSWISRLQCPDAGSC